MKSEWGSESKRGTGPERTVSRHHLIVTEKRHHTRFECILVLKVCCQAWLCVQFRLSQRRLKRLPTCPWAEPTFPSFPLSIAAYCKIHPKAMIRMQVPILLFPTVPQAPCPQSDPYPCFQGENDTTQNPTTSESWGLSSPRQLQKINGLTGALT